MGKRRVPLVKGGYYHAYSKSIAGFEIFRFRNDYLRMYEALRFYRTSVPGTSFSAALKFGDLPDEPKYHGEARVRVLAFCMMPTHLHFLLEQIADDGVRDYLQLVLSSYSHYLNVRLERKGPLWQSRFEARSIETDEDLLHMTRYIHLNPVSAGLVTCAEDWEFSSYREYLGTPKLQPSCDFRRNVSLPPNQYKKFVEDRTDYQRSLQIIKSQLLD